MQSIFLPTVFHHLAPPAARPPLIATHGSPRSRPAFVEAGCAKPLGGRIAVEVETAMAATPRTSHRHDKRRQPPPQGADATPPHDEIDLPASAAWKVSKGPGKSLEGPEKAPGHGEHEGSDETHGPSHEAKLGSELANIGLGG